MRFERVIAAACMMGLTMFAAAGTVTVYPAPAGEPMSKMYTVSVDGKSSPVYVAKVMSMLNQKDFKPGEAGFTSFDLNGTATVTVTYPEKVKEVKVLPTSRGIVAQIAGNTITFTVSKPDLLTVDVNGDWNNSLHVFVNAMDELPNMKDPNLIYFGPGIHAIEPMIVPSGKTVYIAGGAVIYGKLPADGSEVKSHGIFQLHGDHISLRGRGIIDGSLLPDHHFNQVVVAGNDISVEGVTLRDSGSFNLPMRDSNHVTVRNVKILGQKVNSDGMDIISSQNVDISDSFVRTFDDLIVMKSNMPGGQGTKNVTVHHMVLWNEKSHALHMGSEIKEPIENVLFTDADIIHDKGHDWLLRVLDGQVGTARHIVWDGIRVEECRRLMSLSIQKNYNSAEGVEYRGHIEDVTFRNITSPKPEWDRGMWLNGFDKDHAIHGVLFENVVVGGKPLKLSDIQNDGFADGVVVKP